MNNQEARLILQAYRPGGQDAANPLFAEALEQVRRDPELQKWFAAECDLDSVIQSKLQKAVAVPPDLKATLLAQQKIVRPAAWWAQPAWLAAAAACLVLLAGLAGFWLKPDGAPQFAALREITVQKAMQKEEHVSFANGDMAQIRDWLRTQKVSTDFELPVSLHDATLQGCKVVDWQGHKVTMLCLMAKGGGHVDLFVIDCTRFRDFTPSETAQFAEGGGLATAVWRSGDKTYLVAGHMAEAQLRNIL